MSRPMMIVYLNYNFEGYSMPKNKKPPKVNKQEYLEVATEEEWPLWSARKGIDKDDFFRIVDFYVLH